jgi:hypothetical protein
MAWTEIEPGGVLVPDPSGRSLGVVISREEFERRQAAMTPGQRRVSEMLFGHFRREADEMREAHQRAVGS